MAHECWRSYPHPTRRGLAGAQLPPIFDGSAGMGSSHRGLIPRAAEHPYNTTYAPCNHDAPLFVPFSMTRQAVISGIVVNQSLADTDLVASWIDAVSAVAG
ncbi:hypothetical protein PHMEG_00015559 [Phytophthora megakarya]|uniref:Uncharacterized protein n=1 Tax=Phytophthora megakarya TaxID=4795 RepID=A0A225W3I8_9STRA|nr:hypothetical protein PHMEG_00015559 [Phytophthora megakarya]